MLRIETREFEISSLSVFRQVIWSVWTCCTLQNETCDSWLIWDISPLLEFLSWSMRPLPRILRPWKAYNVSPDAYIRCSFSISNPIRHSRFPRGVPAFPIFPSRTQRQPRPLPTYSEVRPHTGRNITIFLVLCGAWALGSLLAINYERFVSPVTASILHEVRKSSKAYALLGNDIQHRSMHPEYKGVINRYDGWFRQPWISGSIQLTKGVIDISYDVKGSSKTLCWTSANELEAEGRVHFLSSRPDKFSKWAINEWTLTSYATGEVVSLLDEHHAIPVPEEWI